jgi:hypothetical protein
VRSLVGVDVRRVHEADWQELRVLRLRALADAPDSPATVEEQPAHAGG